MFLISLVRVKSLSLLLFLLSLFSCKEALSQTKLINNIEEGRDQTIVVYGTSLSSGKNGDAWMSEVAYGLNTKYPGHVQYYLAGKGGKWSTWGVQNLEDRVIKEEPDVVIIGFAINDAFYKYNTSVELAQLNLEYMIDRIKIYNGSTEVILQLMNMPVGKPAEERPNFEAYYEMYRDVAQHRGLLLIDHSLNWRKILNQSKEKFFKYVPDGIHPNGKAARVIIAPFIIDKLEETHT